ncbi:MAG: hypothetical protein ACOC3V_04860 [bacterium]
MKKYDVAIRYKFLFTLLDIIILSIIIISFFILISKYPNYFSFILLFSSLSIILLLNLIYKLRPNYIDLYSIKDLKKIKRMSESKNLDDEIGKYLKKLLKENDINLDNVKDKKKILSDVAFKLRRKITNYYYDFEYWDDLIEEFNKKGN